MSIMKEITYIYYLHVGDNIPFYIGKTKDLIRRKYKHSILYGKIDIEIIDQCDDKKEIWKPLESYWIKYYKQQGFILKNKNEGGGGPTIYSEESKQKMRKSRKKGTGDKISKTLKQNNHSKYYTKEVKDIMSKSQLGKPKPFTTEHKLNMGIAKRKDAKPIIMLDLKNKSIKEWESKGQAAEWLKEQTGKTSNITTQIKDCILGRQKTAYGYKWKYK